MRPIVFSFFRYLVMLAQHFAFLPTMKRFELSDSGNLLSVSNLASARKRFGVRCSNAPLWILPKCFYVISFYLVCLKVVDAEDFAEIKSGA